MKDKNFKRLFPYNYETMFERGMKCGVVEGINVTDLTKKQLIAVIGAVNDELLLIKEGLEKNIGKIDEMNKELQAIKDGQEAQKEVISLIEETHFGKEKRNNNN